MRPIREGTGLTQPEFALRYNFPISELRDLEQGYVRPERSTCDYLAAIGRDPASTRPPKMR